MFDADPSIYNAVGKYPSVADIDTQRAQAQVNQLHAMLMGNEVSQLPLHNQLLQLQLQTGQIGNQKAMQLLGLLGKLSGGQPAPASPAAAIPAAPAPASQWSPGGAQGPSLPAGAPPTALPVTNAPQGQPMPAPVNAPAPSAAPSLGGLGFNDVVGLKALGGPDLTSDFKLMLEGAQAPPGSEVKDPVTGQTHTVMTLKPGQVKNADGSVSYAPNFIPSEAALAGATTVATKQAENANTPLPQTFIDASTGRPVGGTVGGYIAGQTPGAAPAVAPMPIDQLSPSAQAAAVADMTARGQPLSSMKVNGQPAFADVQAQLDAAKAAGPEGVAKLQATMLPRILQMPDPAARAKALQGFAFDLQTPPGTPIHSMGAAPAPGAAPQLAGPADIAGAEVTAKNNADLATKPAVTSANDLAANDQSNFKEYESGLNSAAKEGLFLQQRNAEIRANLQQFQAGLGAGHLRTDIATNLSNMFPGNSAIQAAANTIAGGGPNAIAAATTFNNLVAGAAVTNANQVLDGNGHINRGIVTMLAKGAETSASDPAALFRIMDIQDNLVNQTLAEQKYVADQRRAGTLNPGTIQSDWAQRQQELQKDPTSVFYPVSLKPAVKIQPGGQTTSLPPDIAAILKKHGVTQ